MWQIWLVKPEQTKFDKTQTFSVVHSSTDFCRGNRVIDDVALSCPIGKGFCCCQITVGFPFSLWQEFQNFVQKVFRDFCLLIKFKKICFNTITQNYLQQKNAFILKFVNLIIYLFLLFFIILTRHRI